MQAELLKLYLNKRVGVGVPHFVIPGKIFFYYGTLINVTNTSVVIKNNDGLKEIPLYDIQQIVNDREGNND